MHNSQSNKGGHLIFSTAGMSAQDGLVGWRELLRASPIPTDVEGVGEGRFFAQARVQNIGGLDLLSGVCRHDFAMQSIHGKGEVARSPDNLVLFLQSECPSSHIEYNGSRDATTLQTGDWTIVSLSDVYNWRAKHDTGEFQLLTLPSQFGGDLQAISGDHYGRRMSSRHPVNRLVANYIHTLATGATVTDATTGDAIARNLLELITLAFSSNADAQEVCEDGLASGLLLAITQYLDAHYLEPELSPAQVAAHFGITPRYVHRLFERSGMTFTQQLYDRRLDYAHRLLTGRSHLHRSITSVAYDSGFQSITHFGKRYREKYGRTPSESRRLTIAVGQ